MLSIQITLLQVKSFLVSGIYCLLGMLSIAVPYGIYDIFFGFKGADVGYLGSMLLYIFTGILLTGCIMLFDLLIIRFLFKKKLNNKEYFILGISMMALLMMIFILLS